MQGREAVSPVGLAADQPHQHAARLLKRALDVGVDRERMLQACEIGEPQGRQAVSPAPPAGSKGRKVAVGEREHDEIGRILCEIDRYGSLLKPMALAKDDVHRSNTKPRSDRGLVDIALLADQHQLRDTRARAPRPVELVAYPLADR